MILIGVILALCQEIWLPVYNSCLLSLYNTGRIVLLMTVRNTGDSNYLDDVIYYKNYSKQVREDRIVSW